MPRQSNHLTAKTNREIMTKPRALIICPGRGSYTKDSLGYLRRYAGTPAEPAIKELLATIDDARALRQRIPVSQLDSAKIFDPELYLRGENGAALTFAATVADFYAIRDAVRPVAVVGNSMGWYTALHVAGALDLRAGFSLADELGNLQALGGGSQLIYPIVGDDWRYDAARQRAVTEALQQAAQKGLRAYLSIRLGGYAVLAGDGDALHFLLSALPSISGKGGPTYPLRLPQHAAFHTELMNPVQEHAVAMLEGLPLRAPKISMVDGRGAIFRPLWTSPVELFSYTLGTQVVDTFDFTKAVSVALQEFSPEVIVLLGPGETLGGSVGQILANEGFFQIKSKQDFIERQNKAPFVFATARPNVLAQLTA
jgi:[acyl-carrier-protein] S-malonyltransferase